MRKSLSEPPFRELDGGRPYYDRGRWPAHWIACADAPTAPMGCAYSLLFVAPSQETVRIHVTADERYELFLDGRRIGRGPERGAQVHWYFETYDVPLDPGEHTLAARVWSFGSIAPFAQCSVQHGFLLAAEGRWTKRISTGHAEWRAKPLTGYRFRMEDIAWGTGAFLDADGASMAVAAERGEGDGWRETRPLKAGLSAQAAGVWMDEPLLAPATLPAMMEKIVPPPSVRYVAETESQDTASQPVDPEKHLAGEAADWRALFDGKALTVPPHTKRRVLCDLNEYYCAYPAVTVSGGEGATLHMRWAESLYEQDPSAEPNLTSKGNRDAVAGKHFLGVGDSFRCDGRSEQTFEPPWWRVGRYVEIVVQTADAPLTLEGVTLTETRYPLEREGGFAASDEALARIGATGLRALQACSHETYMDCPYYEQLMYVGDTRLQALVTYVVTADDRLPRKALRMFDISRLPSGLTQARYPNRLAQVIPPFSLWYACMVYDYALWRGDAAFLRGLMPGVRGVLDHFLGCLNADGLLRGPTGWNFVDWIPGNAMGMLPECDRGVSGVLNWHLVLTLNRAAALEEWLGEPESAARFRRLATELAERTDAVFWDAQRGLYADDPDRNHFSEHAQILAVLSGHLPEQRIEPLKNALLQAGDLTQTTIYFSHYLFEMFQTLGLPEALLKRLTQWRELADRGMRTTPERPEPSRSDCHAWGAHPIYHFMASILGIRPASMGFREALIRPQLGPLQWARGRMPHPAGSIEVDLTRDGDTLTGHIILPPGLTGRLLLNGDTLPLKEGRRSL